MKLNVFRMTGWLISLLGIALYALLAYTIPIEWRQNPSIHESIYSEIGFVLHLLYWIGLPPLVVGLYYFLHTDTFTKLLCALAIFAFIFFCHYVVAIFMAMTSPLTYVPMMLVETTIAALLIWFKGKNPSAAEHHSGSEKQPDQG